MLARHLAFLIDLVTINQTMPTEGGFIKRRRWGRSWIIVLGNIYLKLSHSRIIMFPSAVVWQAHECEGYRLLYNRECKAIGRAALFIEQLPGQSLLSHLQSHTLTAAMMTAAAHEFRRAHHLSWTHGDPHLANILYDGARAYLIDFETQHEASVPFQERCADDLLVVLLDLIGRETSEQWQDLSAAFLSGYGEHDIVSALIDRLHIPRYFELVLWKSRTQYLPQDALARRLAQLKRIAEQLL